MRNITGMVVFNANDWFNKATGNPRPFDIANQWRLIRGPIRKQAIFDTEGPRVLLHNRRR